MIRDLPSIAQVVEVKEGTEVARKSIKTSPNIPKFKEGFFFKLIDIV